ncbi:MAG TPA: DUF4437 domain-containing protein [Chloroflexota bacterium]
MGRPVIDFVNTDDLPLHEVVLPGADRPCCVRELSRDAVSGERSLVLDLPAGWCRTTAGASDRDEELFVLAGALVDDGDALSRYSYVFRSAGRQRTAMRTEQGGRVLVFERPGTAYRPERDVAPLNLAALDWERPRTPNFPAGAARKTLRIDPFDNSGLWVIGLLPHWASPFTEWHTVEEENYVLEGEIETTAGCMRPGAYLAHPPEMVHGPMRSRPGALAITRAAAGAFLTTYTRVPDYAFPQEV